MRTILAGLALGALAVSSASAQSVISAHSGVIHYTEGKVFIDDTLYVPKTSEFSDLKNKGVLRTEEGRAELLLTPGVFLRIGENSSVRMLSNHLSDTRIEVLSGEALVECDEILKDNAITVVYKNATVELTKHGLYRFDASQARLRVYDGEAIVKNPAGQLTAKKGHEVVLNDGALMASKFDLKTGDELMRWAARRSGYISMANVSAARSNGYNSGYSSGYGGSGWAFNPWFGMYTYVPTSGILYSPFGYPFWSPFAAFAYAPYWGGYGGYYGGGYYGYGSGYTGGGGSSASYARPAPARWNSSAPYSSSGTARTAPGGVAGAFSRGGGGGYSGGGFDASSGGYSRGGSGGAVSSGGGGFSGGSVAPAGGGVSGGGGGHAGGGGGHR